jgi:predicted metalloprotease with PDZ domain
MRIVIRLCLWLVLPGAIISLAFVVHTQRELISELREQNRVQQVSLKELDRLRAENQEAQHLQNQQAELARLREDHNELLRLRNETRQLRDRLAELETLRTANARLLQAVQGAPALPSNQAALVMSARKAGSILGVSVKPPASGRPGAEVTWIDPKSPVVTSGLAVGDNIYAIDGRRVQTPGDLQSQMLTRKPGEIVSLDVLRNETPLRVQVQTRAWPQ